MGIPVFDDSEFKVEMPSCQVRFASVGHAAGDARDKTVSMRQLDALECALYVSMRIPQCDRPSVRATSGVFRLGKLGK